MNPSESPQTLRDRALGELQRALKEEQGFVKVHAADALLDLDQGQQVAAEFEEELKLHGSESPYCIGIWRVLARAASNSDRRQEFAEKICGVAFEPKEAHGDSALESLAKLKKPVSAGHLSQIRRIAESREHKLTVNGNWLLATTGNDAAIANLVELLTDRDAVRRYVAAYAISFSLSPAALPGGAHEAIAQAAANETDSNARSFLISAAYISAPNDSEAARFRSMLVPFVSSSDSLERCEAIRALGVRGDESDLAALSNLLAHSHADTRVRAAEAILQIGSRRA